MLKDTSPRKLRNCCKRRRIVIDVSVAWQTAQKKKIILQVYSCSPNKAAHLRHHHHISLREQLQVAGAANNPIMQGSNSVGNATTPGSDSRKSIFNRLGIRKPSILSLSSPQFPSSSTARTFSLDDLLRPTPRRKHILLDTLTLFLLYFLPSPLFP